MELKITGKTFEYMDAVFSGVQETEKTAEKIVPDSFEDVAEIICADAVPLLRSKDAYEGRVSVSGIAEINAICRLENGKAAALSLEAPLDFTAEAPGVSENGAVIASLNTLSVTAQLLNPRKISVTVKAAADIAVFEKRSVTVPDTVPDEIEARLRTEDYILPEGAFENTFSVSGEASAHGAADIGEIISVRTRLGCDEKKAVGSKLIVRGTAAAEVVYLPSGGGAPECADFTVPFSQVVDAGENAEERSFSVTSAVTGIAVSRSETSGLPNVEISAVLQCVSFSKASFTYISDAYSPEYALDAQYETLCLYTGDGAAETTGTLRGTISSAGAEKVLSVSALCPSQAEAGDGRVFADISLRALCVCGGELKCLSGTFTAEAPYSGCAENARVQVSVPREIYALPSSQSVDFRTQAVFNAECISRPCIRYLAGVQSGEEVTRKDAPSVVLYRVCGGETLWDMGKKWRTHPSAIAEANGLDADAAPETGRLLIIPAGA